MKVTHVIALIVAAALISVSATAYARNTSGSSVIASSIAGLLNLQFCSISASPASVTTGDQFTLRWRTFNMGNPILWHEGKGGGESSISKTGQRLMIVGTDVRAATTVVETEYFQIGRSAGEAQTNPKCKASIRITPQSAPSAASHPASGADRASDEPVAFYLSPASITTGKNSTLTWRVLRDDLGRCTLRSGTLTYTVGKSGTMMVSPRTTTTYTLSCYDVVNGVLSEQRDATLTVGARASTSTNAPATSGTRTPPSGGGGSSGGSAFGGGMGGGGYGGGDFGGFGSSGGWGGFGNSVIGTGAGGGGCLSMTGCGTGAGSVDWE